MSLQWCQSYEIKLKKTGDYGELKGKLYKSVVQVGFQERRLQYMEKEQIAEWQSERPGERILEADIPLSYGVLEISNCSQNINMCEFVWDPVKENGVFLKVNCISTEFTAKKHGGEKGVPFRILIETYMHDGSWMRVHSASCQVKVFKPKGADRKHKTDREKMLRKSQVDREKYHPQYEYTVLREVSSSELWSPPPVSSCVQPTLSISSPTSSSPVSSQCSASSPIPNILSSSQAEDHQGTPATSTTEPQECPSGPAVQLSSESSAKETTLWLKQNMFGSFIKDFTHFSGSDLLKLKRQDLIEICGLAHGIRLYNLLHIRPPCPCLTLYLRFAQQQAFHAIYLETTDVSELLSKIKAISNLPTEYNCEIYICGPAKIHIIVTDEVIQNMTEESMFTVECLKGHFSDQCSILLKPFSCKNPCENI